MSKWPAACFMFALLVGQALAGRTMVVVDAPRPAPDFELPSTDGSSVRLSDFRGKYLLVNFWAVWCTPCRKEMPSMQNSYAQLKGPDFEMLAIHVGPTLEGAAKFASDLGLTFPVLVDQEMDLGSWSVIGLPSTFLVDPEGQIIGEAVGERDWSSPEMLEQLRKLIE